MIRFEHEDETGLVTEYELPSKREVCERCEGYGTHLHEAIGSHAYSREEFEEEFSEDEDRAAYFERGGMYDVVCSECHGRNVVEVVDEAQARRECPKVLALYFEIQDEEASYRRECEAERRMGA